MKGRPRTSLGCIQMGDCQKLEILLGPYHQEYKRETSRCGNTTSTRKSLSSESLFLKFPCFRGLAKV